MSTIAVTNVEIQNPTTKFTDLINLAISLNCLSDLPGQLECELIWVGSAESANYDQCIDSVSVGPIPAGNHQFNFEAQNQIDPTKIHEGELIGPTVMLLRFLYNTQEFCRVGYYVNVAYDSLELNENPPATVDFDHLGKEILSNEPRITRFRINWEADAESSNRFSISNEAVENTNNVASGQVGAGMSEQQLGCGSDENQIPIEMLKEVGKDSILANRMEALLAGISQ